MSRVLMSTQGWGVLQDANGTVQAAQSVTVKNRDGTNATHYSARTGGSSSTSSITSSATGTLDRWIDPGSYTITVNSTDYDIEAVSAEVVNEQAWAHDSRFAGGVDINNSGTDNAAALQAWFDAMATTTLGRGSCPPGQYDVSDQVVLPVGGAANSLYIAEGYGAELVAADGLAEAMLSDSVPADLSTANTRASNRRAIIRGFKFDGDETTAGQAAIRLIAHTGPVVEQCSFDGFLGGGLDLVFCLHASVRDCQAARNNTFDFRARSGVSIISGAGEANSPTNKVSFEKCRAYARSGQTAQFVFESVGGGVMRDCTTEGLNPVDAIKWSASGTGTGVIRSFKVENHHSENTPSGAVVRTEAYGQHWFEIDHHGGAAIVVDASGSNAAAFIRVHVPELLTGIFKGDSSGCRWIFDTLDDGTFDPRTTSNWSGATVPNRIHYIMRDASAYPVVAGWQGLTIQRSGGLLGFFGTTPAARASAYTVTNGTTDRAFDANATTLDEVADVLGTLIADLKTYGLLQ